MFYYRGRILSTTKVGCSFLPLDGALWTAYFTLSSDDILYFTPEEGSWACNAIDLGFWLHNHVVDPLQYCTIHN